MNTRRAWKAFRDLFSMIETAELRGHTKGHAEGLEEGRAEGLKEGQERLEATARNLKQMGLPIADIAKATGLSEEEIRQL